jgi:hypothetical protein
VWVLVALCELVKRPLGFAIGQTVLTRNIDDPSQGPKFELIVVRTVGAGLATADEDRTWTIQKDENGKRSDQREYEEDRYGRDRDVNRAIQSIL